MRLGLLVAISLALSGCANMYEKYYKDRTGGGDLTRSSRVILSSDMPEQLSGRNGREAEDNLRMVEDGFRLIGMSSFTGPQAGAAHPGNAVTQAGKVHASAVMIYPPKYAGTAGGIHGALAGPYPTYEFLATYWTKLKPPIFGIYVDPLSAEPMENTRSNKGVIVQAVVRNSPAFRAGILRGDVLTHIGEKEIADRQGLSNALDQYVGKTVIVKYVRAGKEFTKEVAFND